MRIRDKEDGEEQRSEENEVKGGSGMMSLKVLLYTKSLV